MRIALDYDKTYTAHPALWDAFLVLCQHNGHEVCVVTARSPVIDRTEALVELEAKVRVIYTNGIAKKFHCAHWTGGWEPDIWIDDKPEAVLYNSTTSPQDLVEWRAYRNEGPTFPKGDPWHPIIGQALQPPEELGGGRRITDPDYAHEVSRLVSEGGPGRDDD